MCRPHIAICFPLKHGHQRSGSQTCMSQPEREGLSGGEAGPGFAAAGGLIAAAGVLADKEGPLSGGSHSSGSGESS